jgi:hypothetical protein
MGSFAGYFASQLDMLHLKQEHEPALHLADQVCAAAAAIATTPCKLRN